jgi:hypothetical protein
VSRWEFLEGVKPVTPADTIVVEMAKVIAREIEGWPPQIEWVEASSGARFAPLYAPRAARPSDAAIREGFRLARWELLHELEAIDFYLRNDQAAQVARTRIDRLGLELLWKLLPEMLYELAERTENRLKRKHLVACLDLAERRLFPDALPS